MKQVMMCKQKAGNISAIFREGLLKHISCNVQGKNLQNITASQQTLISRPWADFTSSGDGVAHQLKIDSFSKSNA